MRVSASILAVKSNYLEYAKTLKYVNIDCLHIDIFQNGNEFKIKDLLQFDKTYLPLDVHLIFEEISDEDIEILNKVKVHYLNIQYEPLKDKRCIAHIAQKFEGNFGISITAKTPLDVIDENINYISQVLFMCSEPGISGAKFDDSNFERIEKIHRKYPSLDLYADGGVNNIISEKMEKLGVSMVVSGSYLSKDMDNLNINAYSLKFVNEKDIQVTRKMIKVNSLPILKKDADFMEIITTMNKYRLGIVMIVENDILLGIIADGDIRREFLSCKESIFTKKACDIMNHNPIVIQSDKNIEDIFKVLSTSHKGIDVVPVIEKGKLVGALDLHIGL